MKKEYKVYRIYKTLVGVGSVFSVFALLPLQAQEAASTSTSTPTPTLDELKQQIEALQQKVGELQAQQEAATAQNQKLLTNFPTITASSKGFEIQSADKQFDLKLQGLLQVDDREFLTPGNNGGYPGDGFYVRRLRPIISGTLWGAYDFDLEPDFGSRSGGAGGTSGSTAVLANAYINVHYNDTVQLQVGRWKGPVGYERTEPSQYSIWIENGLTQNLTPNYYQGAQLHGKIYHGLFTWSGGVGQGVRDNANSDVQSMIDNNYDAIGSVGFQPFVNSDIKAIKGVQFGVGGTVGDRGDVGTAANASLATYTTPGQTPLLTYNTTAATGQTVVEYEDGQGWRLAPYAAYYYGPLGVYGDYGLSSIEATRTVSGTGAGTGSRSTTFQNQAWQVVASYVLTGEDASYTGVKPRSPFSPKNHTWGAFQALARYGELRLDSAYFDTYGATATSSKGAFATGPQNSHDIGVGLNWYLNDNVKAQLDYDYISYSGGNAPVTPANEDENVFITQLQLAF